MGDGRGRSVTCQGSPSRCEAQGGKNPETPSAGEGNEVQDTMSWGTPVAYSTVNPTRGYKIKKALGTTKKWKNSNFIKKTILADMTNDGIS